MTEEIKDYLIHKYKCVVRDEIRNSNSTTIDKAIYMAKRNTLEDILIDTGLFDTADVVKIRKKVENEL